MVDRQDLKIAPIHTQPMKKSAVDHKKAYFSWKEKYAKGIPDISEKNSRIILNYILDMEYT